MVPLFYLEYIRPTGIVAYDGGPLPLPPHCLAGRPGRSSGAGGAGGSPIGQTQPEARGQGSSPDVILQGQPVDKDEAREGSRMQLSGWPNQIMCLLNSCEGVGEGVLSLAHLILGDR